MKLLKCIFNTYRLSVVDLVRSIILFVWRLAQPFLIPWSSAHVSVLYGEILRVYLEGCKLNKLPFVDPAPDRLFHTAADISNAKMFKNVVVGIKTNYTNFIPRLIVIPYNISSESHVNIQEIQKEAREYNEQFKLEVKSIDNSGLIGQSLLLYKTLFEIRETT